MIKAFRFNKLFIKTFFLLSLPLAMQNLLTTMVNLVDNLMIGRLGDCAIASVSLANQYFFVYSLIVFGACSGSSVFVSQYWGKKDLSGIRNVAAISTYLSFAVGMIFGLAAYLIPETIMRFFSDDPIVIMEGAKYLKILAISYPLVGLANSFSYLLKSLEQVKPPLYCSLIAIFINIVFNYLLIFGNFGFPKLGVAGAAYATLIAKIVEFALILLITFINVDFLRENIKDYTHISKDFIKKFITTAAPVILNETIWSLGITTYYAFFARLGDSPQFGTSVVAAVNITSLSERLASVFIFGMGHAASIIIAKEIGAGKRKKAIYSATQLCFLTPIAGIIFGGILILLAPYFLMLFNISDLVRSTSYHLIIILGILLPIKSFSLINIVGTLRGGGDTKYAFYLDAGGVWLIGIPLVYITGLILKLPVEVVYLSSLIEEVVKCFLIIYRLKSLKWVNDLVNF